MSSDILPPGEKDQGQQAGFGVPSQGVPYMAQPPTNPSSVPGAQAQLSPAQNVQLSSNPGQVFFTPDGRAFFQQPNMGAQPSQAWPANQQQMTAMQVPYSANQPPPYTPAVTAAGVDLRPPSYIVMTFIVAFICFFLNITTLMFGIPAIVLSVLSEENKKNGEYSTAKKYGKIALGINIANIVYTLVVAIIIVSTFLGIFTNYFYYY